MKYVRALAEDAAELIADVMRFIIIGFFGAFGFWCGTSVIFGYNWFGL